MALFNKKKTPEKSSGVAPTPAAPDDAAPADDFSDFSPEALAGEGDSAAKGKAKKARAEKSTASSGRGVKPGTALGLNIGTDSIKVLEATAKGNTISITAMGMVPTPADSISNGVVMSANALVMAIRDALAQAGVKSKKVVTSISGTGALVVRVIEVPKMSDGELLDNMKMDADRYIPFPPSEVEMDFKALRDLPSDPDSPNMEVLLAAAQREIIDLHVQVLQDAKLDPRAIDVEPLAVARALTHPLTEKEPNGQQSAALGSVPDYNDVFAVLNIGASGVEISILRGDLLVFTRTVPTGGNALTQALVDNLGLAWSDAEQLKREMGDALEPADGDATLGGSTLDAGLTLDKNSTIAPDDDWSHFAEDANAPAAQADGADTAPAADPFEDDFFEQGPTQNEPGEQHQQKEEPQKEGEVPAGSTPAARPFFDFGDETEPKEEMPTIEDGRPTSYADLLGVEEDDTDELPSLAPGVPKPGALPSAFDFPEEPPAATAAARAAAEVFGDAPVEDKSELPTLKSGAPASTESVGDTRVDTEDTSVLPSETTGGAVPFSFSFDDAAPATPPASTPPTGQATSEDLDFGFESPAEETAPEPVAPVTADDPFAEFMASAAETAPAAESGSTPATPAPTTSTAPAADVPAAGAAEAADDFDLDSIFGEDATAVAAGSTPTVDTATMDAGDLGMGDIGEDFSAELSDFGAGLGGAAVGEIDAKTLHGVLTPVLENLVNEVRRSLEYHTTRYPDAAVRRVVVVGGGAKLKNLDAYLTQQLGLPATIGNPALQLEHSAPKLPPGYIEENGPLFAVALGLAMRELTK